MNTVLENKPTHIRFISACTPLAGIAIGAALFLLGIEINAFAKNNETSILNIPTAMIFLWISTYGFPTQTIFDKRTGNYLIIRFRKFKFRRYLLKATDVIDLSARKPTSTRSRYDLCEINTKHGHVYIFNLFGFLLTPKRHKQTFIEFKNSIESIKIRQQKRQTFRPR